MPLGLSVELQMLAMIPEAVNSLALLCLHDSAAAAGQQRVLEPRANCHKREKLLSDLGMHSLLWSQIARFGERFFWTQHVLSK